KPGSNPRRRPADLRREALADGDVRGGRASPGAGPPREGWPVGFARRRRDREALLVLSGLPSLTAGRLLDLAAERRTAAGCLEAVLAGQAGSERTRSLAASLRPESVRERMEAIGARVVAVHDEEYPATLLDLFDPP